MTWIRTVLVVLSVDELSDNMQTLVIKVDQIFPTFASREESEINTS